MDDGTMTSTDEAMALIRAADADPRGTVLMLLRVLGGGLATATRERDEARAELAAVKAAAVAYIDAVDAVPIDCFLSVSQDGDVQRRLDAREALRVLSGKDGAP